jgi:Fic family protein
MISALNKTALLTIQKIRGILNLQKEMRTETMAILEKFNNREKLFDLMFTVPYLKIDLIVKKGLAHRQTAALYLNLLESKGILKPLKKGRTTYYLNHRLMKLITSR